MVERLQFEGKELTLVEEAERARRESEQGLYNTITSERYPKLTLEDPQLLSLYRLTAMGNRMRQLSNIRTLVRDDRKASVGISEEISGLLDEIHTTSREAFPHKGSEGTFPEYFYLYREERDTLEFAISIGFPEEINLTNVPSLVGLSGGDIVRLKLLSIANALKGLDIIETEAKPGTGIGASRSGLPNTQQIIKTIRRQFEVMSEALSSELLDTRSKEI